MGLLFRPRPPMPRPAPTPHPILLIAVHLAMATLLLSELINALRRLARDYLNPRA